MCVWGGMWPLGPSSPLQHVSSGIPQSEKPACHNLFCTLQQPSVSDWLWLLSGEKASSVVAHSSQSSSSRKLPEGHPTLWLLLLGRWKNRCPFPRPWDGTSAGLLRMPLFSSP